MADSNSSIVKRLRASVNDNASIDSIARIRTPEIPEKAAFRLMVTTL
jgi:hypothetical protein